MVARPASSVGLIRAGSIAFTDPCVDFGFGRCGSGLCWHHQQQCRGVLSLLKLNSFANLVLGEDRRHSAMQITLRCGHRACAPHLQCKPPYW